MARRAGVGARVDPLRIIHSPRVPHSLEQWLEDLGEAALLYLPGAPERPTRALSVLLHGNERSGLIALHRYLVEGRVPARRTLCFIGAVQAARSDPPRRIVAGRRDLNRCFLEPGSDANGALAEDLLRHLRAASPEALVDLHNNSGHNPAYGVIVDTEPTTLALVELFTERAVLNTLHLGTLVEAQVEHCPSVVIECGQAGAPEADEVAYRGMCRYLESESLASSPAGKLQVFRNTVRFEIRPGIRPIFVSDGEPSRLRAGQRPPLALRADLEIFNFRTVPTGEVLGWCDAELLPIVARDANGADLAGEYLEVRAGTIRAIRDFKPIMMSVRPDVAVDDCLCYLVDEHGLVRT